MAGPHPGDFLALMARRGDLLRLLGARPREKLELEAELDVSRSTIDRAIRDLEARDFVTRTPDGYRQTLSGRLALAEYDRFTGRIQGICESSTVLASLARETDVDLAMLEDATVARADRTSPHRPLEELYGLVEVADSVTGFAPAIHPQQVETYRTRIEEHGMTADLVVTDGVVERLLADYADAFATVVETDDVRLRVTAEELAYSLTIAETPDGPVAAIMVYADDGIRGCIHNDEPAAIRWARDRFERVAADATAVGEPPSAADRE